MKGIIMDNLISESNSSLSRNEFQNLIDGKYQKILDIDEFVKIVPMSFDIIVLWCGGNGPHRYALGKRDDSFAAFTLEDNYFVGYLDDIGDYPLDQVWYVDPTLD